MKLPSSLKSAARSLLSYAFATPLLQPFFGSGIVMCYHRVINGPRRLHNFADSGLVVHIDEFEKQIDMLTKRYRCIAMKDLSKELEQGINDKPFAVVTFDDGYRDNLTLALPILERYNIPATIFIANGLIDGTSTLWWMQVVAIVEHETSLRFRWRNIDFHYILDTPPRKSQSLHLLNDLFKGLHPNDQAELLGILRSVSPVENVLSGLMLSWDEIRTLSRHPLITIGGHTNRHPVLSRLSDTELLDELSSSKRELEEKIGMKTEHFAYPFGGPNQAGEREFEAAAKVGYSTSVTTRIGHIMPRHAKHLHALPRVSMDYFDGDDLLEWKLSGGFALHVNRGRRFITA